MSVTASKSADASAKSPTALVVKIEGDPSFSRLVQPKGNVPIPEIVAAMKRDWNFLSPLVQFGLLTRFYGTGHVTLGRYELTAIDDAPRAEITEVTAEFADGSSENVAI